MQRVHYPFHSLEDFLISTPLTVDGQLNDGWGAYFPVKGREIDATILFADISGFSRRTLELSSTETLIFVNNFFSWITAQALRDTKGIVDKYIGDEIMIVFSREFGSDDPFVDAVRAARNMAEHDVHNFCPHVGIASGQVTVGYVGTPVKYNSSVFGAPVALAARCAAVKPPEGQFYSSFMVFPAEEWGDRDLPTVLPPEEYRLPNGATQQQEHAWTMLPESNAEMKNVGTVPVRIVANSAMHLSQWTAEGRAQESLQVLKTQGAYQRKTT
jgi:hypothetical protein